MRRVVIQKGRGAMRSFPAAPAALLLMGSLLLGSLLVGLGSAPALAQETSEEGGVSYQRKTVINFEDDTIEGDLKTPDGQYLEARKKVRHKSLIRIRTDFRREVLGSIADL